MKSIFSVIVIICVIGVSNNLIAQKEAMGNKLVSQITLSLDSELDSTSGDTVECKDHFMSLFGMTIYTKWVL